MQCIYNFAMKFSRKETVKISIIYSLILIFVNKLKNTEQYKKYSDSFYQSVVRAAAVIDFAFCIIEAVQGKAKAEEVARSIYY